MATVRWRRKRWVCDWRRPDGRRGFKSFKSREAADRYLGEQLRASAQRTVPVVDPRVTVAAYADRWIQTVEATQRFGTLVVYRGTLRRHIVPRIGTDRLTSIDRPRIRALLLESKRVGFSANTVRLVHQTLSRLMGAAVEDGLVLANPCDGLLKGLGLASTKRSREEAASMTRPERDALLDAAKRVQPHYWPILFCLSRTGMRVGEGIALRWSEVDLANGTIEVKASCTRGRLGPTKTGVCRSVDISPELGELLAGMRVSPTRLKLGRPEWVFTSPTGVRMDYGNLVRAFGAARKEAKTPLRFTIHSLRHTFARLVLEAGGDVLWVQRQLGHASIGMTADLYGRWAEVKRPGLIAVLDGGSSLVAKPTENGGTT